MNTGLLQSIGAFILILIMSVASISFGWTNGSSDSFNSRLTTAQGKVSSYASSLVFVEFNKPIVNKCGDTDIHGFITTPENFSVQLKSVFVPSAKADEVDDRRLIFPVSDVEPFLQSGGIYTIEFFVENNCSIFHNQTVELPPVSFIVDRAEEGEIKWLVTNSYSNV